jgi:hypothetical protein
MASDVLSGEEVAVLERLRDLSDHSVNLDRHRLLRPWACPRSELPISRPVLDLNEAAARWGVSLTVASWNQIGEWL